LINYHQN